MSKEDSLINLANVPEDTQFVCLQQVESKQVNEYKLLGLNSSPVQVFGWPLLIVFFAAFLKYGMFHKPKKREVSYLFYDFCIDSMIIGITILSSYWYMLSDLYQFAFSAIWGFIFLICLYYRVKNNDGKANIRHHAIAICLAVFYITSLLLKIF